MRKQLEKIDRRQVFDRICQASRRMTIGRLAKHLGTSIGTLDRMRHLGGTERTWARILIRLEELEKALKKLRLPPENFTQMWLFDLYPPGVKHNRYGVILD